LILSMVKRIVVLLLFSSLFFPGCFLQKPVKIEVVYYENGHVKQVKKYYKKGLRVKYYAMEKKRKKPYGLFHRKKYPK